MTQSKNVIAVTDESFDEQVLAAEGPVLVELSATWCGPCKALAPIVDAIADENVGKVKVASIDMDASPNVAARYGVRAAPTVIVFRGGERKAQHVGLTTKQKLLAMLEA